MKAHALLPEAPPRVRARLYAALHTGTPGDVEFYLRASEGARKILEYGCGAGRIALALAERGHAVVGVDLDVALLDLARENKAAREAELGRPLPVEFVEGDMTTFAKRGCDRVVIPYSALWCLPGTVAKRQCLAKARASLVRGGQLVFDVYDADVLADGDFDGDSNDSDFADAFDGRDLDAGAAPDERRESVDANVEQDEFEELHRVKLDAVTYRVWERNTWNRGARAMQVEYRLLAAPPRKAAATKPASKAALRRGLASRRSLTPATVSRSGKAVAAAPVPAGYQLTLTHSVLWRHELAELLDECGFDVEWGVDEAGEDTPFAEQVVVRAVRT